MYLFMYTYYQGSPMTRSLGGYWGGVNLGGSSGATKNTRSKKVHFYAYHSL